MWNFIEGFLNQVGMTHTKESSNYGMSKLDFRLKPQFAPKGYQSISIFTVYSRIVPVQCALWYERSILNHSGN